MTAVKVSDSKALKGIKDLVFPLDIKSKQIYVPIQPAANLYLSFTRSGTKSFCFRKFTNGNWRSIDLGCRFVDEMDATAQRLCIQAAQAKAMALTATLSQGGDPFAAAKELKVDPTFQELFDHYKKGHLEKRAKRVDEISKDFLRWFGTLAKKRSSTITYSEVNKLHQQMSTRISAKTKKPAVISANRMLQLGRAIFNFALKTKVVKGDNPFSGVSHNIEATRERFLTDDEAGKLLSTVVDVPNKHCNQRTLYDFVLLGMSLGVRKSNLLTMNWNEIDEESWIWLIPGEKMKNGKAKAMRLGPAEITVLTERRQLLLDAGIISPWVFPSSKSATGHLVDPGNAWERLRKELGMPDLTMHDLRRSLASAMINSGTDSSIVQRALSHTDPRTTAKHYIRTTAQAELDARQIVHQARMEAATKAKIDNVVPIESNKKASKL